MRELCMEETPQKVKDIIKSYLHTNTRLRFYYGDAKTGTDWMEIFDNMGTIGMSTGIKPIPLLIKTARSLGGTALLTKCIVKITKDKTVIYQHPKYNLPKLSIKKVNDQYHLIAEKVGGAKTILCSSSLDEVNHNIDYLNGKTNKL